MEYVGPLIQTANSIDMNNACMYVCVRPIKTAYETDALGMVVCMRRCLQAVYSKSCQQHGSLRISKLVPLATRLMHTDTSPHDHDLHSLYMHKCIHSYQGILYVQ